MTTTPPSPLPEASRKRLLPAFLLCITLGGLHRIYAGKIISGIIQFGWLAGASVWSYQSIKGFLAILHSGALDMDMIDRLGEWKDAHAADTSLPSLALTAVSIWIAVDAVRLLRKKFTDGRGLPITRWLPDIVDNW